MNQWKVERRRHGPTGEAKAFRSTVVDVMQSRSPNASCRAERTRQIPAKPVDKLGRNRAITGVVLTVVGVVLLLLAGLWAGIQNALAGGGTFVTLPALIASGMDALSANITSTVAMFPGQVATGLAGRSMVRAAGALSFGALFVISLTGGVLGAVLLLLTPASIFEHLVPWLVLFATAVFAWGSFRPRPSHSADVRLGPVPAGMAQFVIAIYGGYFGGGIGFLMLAALSIAGLPTRHAGATKNVLAGVMNASAVAIFAFSEQVHWLSAAVLGGAAIIGGVVGAWLLRRVDEKLLRALIVLIGLALTIGLFVRPV